MTREEAIKILSERHSSALFSERTALETLIPELKESEDEKIRKAILEFFKLQDDNTTYFFIPKKSILAWLEKQKEQKSLNISAASEWLRKHVCIYMNSEYNEFHKCVEYDGSIDKERLVNDFEEAMQKEQKSSINIDQLKSLMLQYLQEAANEKDDSAIEADTDKWARKILGYDFEQNPVEGEWPNLSNCIRNCKKCHGKCLYRKEPYEEKQPAEWNEEDERIRQRIIKAIRLRADDMNEEWSDEIAWLEKQKEQKLTNEYQNWELIHEFVEKFGRIPKDEDELNALVDYVLKRLKPSEFDEYKIIKKHITEDSLSSEVNKRLTECGWYVTEMFNLKPEQKMQDMEEECNIGPDFIKLYEKIKQSPKYQELHKSHSLDYNDDVSAEKKYTAEEVKQILEDFGRKMLESQEEMPAEFQKIINEYWWEMLDDKEQEE